MYKSRLDFREPGIQAVKRGLLPSMSAVSPFCLKLHVVPTTALVDTFRFRRLFSRLDQEMGSVKKGVPVSRFAVYLPLRPGARIERNETDAV